MYQLLITVVFNAYMHIFSMHSVHRLFHLNSNTRYFSQITLDRNGNFFQDDKGIPTNIKGLF